MTKDEHLELIKTEIFPALLKLKQAGNDEYAAGAQSAFDNFERLGEELDLSREKMLWVYAKKHMDGIRAWLVGHRSQREPVKGRILDLIVYLLLLYGMAKEAEPETSKHAEGLVPVGCPSCGHEWDEDDFHTKKIKCPECSQGLYLPGWVLLVEERG